MPAESQQGYRDVFKRAVNEAQNFFRDSFDNAINGSANYLRDGNPSSITGKAAQTINRRQCEVWGKNPSAFRPAWSDQLSDICGPYLEAKGLPIGPPDARFPFTGGQCVDLYRGIGTLDYIRLFCNSGQRIEIVGETWATEFNIQGPISSVAGRIVNPGTCGAQIWGLFAQTAGGERLLAQVLGVNGVFSSIEHSFTVDFERVGGQPDDCGNVPPGYDRPPPYGPPLPPSPRLVPSDPNSPGVEVTVNPDGSIEVCSGDQCITIAPGPAGEIPGDEPGGSDEPTPPGDQGNPGDEQPDVDDVAEGQCEESNLVGVLVDTVIVPPRANRFFNSVESYSKGGYFVYFGGEGGFAQNPEAALSRQSQFYYAPEGCNRWRVVVNNGYRVNVTPFCKEN